MPELLVHQIIVLCFIRDVLYFITGGWLFLAIANSLPRKQKTPNTNADFVVHLLCSFIVWCWLYSKLIVL